MSFGRERVVCWFILAAVLIGSLLLKLNHLGHHAITGLDESFHAIVARNMLDDPLAPTLYQKQYLESDPLDWQFATVWLHKPPLAMWQIAASFALLGETALALRLPSALLATGAVWLTYLIGARLLTRRAGLVAAALQALNPATHTLVHGYIFSDHVDVALLFWMEVGIWFVVRAAFDAPGPTTTPRATPGRHPEAYSPKDLAPACGEDPSRSTAQDDARGMRPVPDASPVRFVVLAGIAQGLAFLTKTYPAMIVSVVFIAAWALTRRRSRIRIAHLALFFGATLLVIVPWNLWCWLKFPEQFLASHALILRHLHTNVENWAGPWDRLIFDYLLRTFHVFHPMLLAGAALLGWRAWRRRDPRVAVILVWLLVGVGVHMLAVSKTPSGALVAWPAGWLLLGVMMDRALRGDVLMLGAWCGASVIGIVWVGSFPKQGIGFPATGFAGVLRENQWSLWHALIAAACGFASAIVAAKIASKDRRWLGTSIALVASAASFGLLLQYAHVSWRVTEQNRNEPSYVEIGAYVRNNLPGNAVLLVDETQKLEHKTAMFYAHRAAYPMPQLERLAPAIEHIRAKGGVPFVITPRLLPWPMVFYSERDQRTVYGVIGE